ncbi:MAG: D-glycerate dehydrogenase [Nitrospirales bacterium]|nr:D-glycerate dehydrogenase [Nitrospira sp.]MDR4500167.1 D-glycerate dehydrogenase [Nitrospirales bacterium]
MSKPPILLTRRIPQAGLDLLDRFCEVRMWEKEAVVPTEWLMEHVPSAKGLVCLLTDQIDKPVLDVASSLKVVSTMAVGYDHINIAECTRRGIPVGYTPGVLTETTADFAFALMMAAARRVVEGASFVKEGRWKTWSPTFLLGQDLHEATLGIVGFGRIGQAMARRAKGFSMRVLACCASKQVGPQDEGLQDVEFRDFQTVLKESDFVSLHVPLTPQTHHLIGKTELQRMKTSSILINTARGRVIDSDALYEALGHHVIAYAALDVTDPEPIPVNDRLLTLSNCLIVPHIASASVATRSKMAVMTADNLLAGLKGERLPFIVNPEVYGNAKKERA